jgi:hypothetical protein
MVPSTRQSVSNKKRDLIPSFTLHDFMFSESSSRRLLRTCCQVRRGRCEWWDINSRWRREVWAASLFLELYTWVVLPEDQDAMSPSFESMVDDISQSTLILNEFWLLTTSIIGGSRSDKKYAEWWLRPEIPQMWCLKKFSTFDKLMNQQKWCRMCIEEVGGRKNSVSIAAFLLHQKLFFLW